MTDDTATRSEGIVTCDACPVLCRIRPGRSGACDRYGNVNGVLTRLDPFVVTQRVAEKDGKVVPFGKQAWEGSLVSGAPVFVTGIGSGTTYPDYKPAPFIVSSQYDGVDMVTVVSEGIFSYCGLKVKIDTDRYIGPETAAARVDGEQVGHVTTAEYGSQMLSLGGVRHLTGGSKQEGNVTCATMLKLCDGEAVDVTVDGGAQMTIRAGAPPVINGNHEERMRVGCGSATIGIFAKQWYGEADEVIVVDDHITGVLTEHQAGRFLNMKPSGIRVRGRKSTPGRYFQVAEPGTGWGGTDIVDPLAIIEKIDPQKAWPGLRLLMVSTTGEDAAFFTAGSRPRAAVGRDALRIAGGGRPDRRELRAGAVHGHVHGRGRRQPARGHHREPGAADALGQAGADARHLRRRPGLRMAGRRHHFHGRRHHHAGELLRLRADAGDRRADRVHAAPRRLCCHGRARARGSADRGHRGDRPTEGGRVARPGAVAWGAARARGTSGVSRERIGAPPIAAVLPDGRRRHFQHGPIDLVLEAFGERSEVQAAYDQAWGRFQTVLDELVAELPALRAPLGDSHVQVKGAVAREMVRACAAHRGIFVTPMAAVAGAVADAVLAAMTTNRWLDKAYVNNGGDIALFLAPGQTLTTGLVTLGEEAVARRVLTHRSGVPGPRASPRAGGAAEASRWGSRIP